jgi:hypothetical protein
MLDLTRIIEFMRDKHLESGNMCWAIEHLQEMYAPENSISTC